MIFFPTIDSLIMWFFSWLIDKILNFLLWMTGKICDFLLRLTGEISVFLQRVIDKIPDFNQQVIDEFCDYLPWPEWQKLNFSFNDRLTKFMIFCNELLMKFEINNISSYHINDISSIISIIFNNWLVKSAIFCLDWLKKTCDFLPQVIDEIGDFFFSNDQLPKFAIFFSATYWRNS